jgi:hypothetical protein
MSRVKIIRKFVKMQLANPERNLASIDVLIATGACFLAAGWLWYKTLLVVSELVRQQRILYPEIRGKMYRTGTTSSFMLDLPSRASLGMGIHPVLRVVFFRSQGGR